MPSRVLRAAAVACALIAALASPGQAQLNVNLGALTPDNAKGYLEPLAKGLSTTLNMAEFQSAQLPFAGFNLTIGVQAMGVKFDSADRTYLPTDPPGFTHTEPQVEAPTVIGNTQAVAQPGEGGTTLYNPGGFDISQFTVAVPQLSIGSVFGTRALVRWVNVNAGNSDLGQVSLFGLGLQHSLSHWLPMVPCDLAVGGMYQTFTIGKDKLLDTKAFHAEVTASKHMLKYVQPYAGLGYDTFSMDVNYDQSTGGGTVSTHVKMDDQNSFHGNVGLLLDFPVVKLNAQVDAAKETGAAVGIRFGFGS